MLLGDIILTEVVVDASSLFAKRKEDASTRRFMDKKKDRHNQFLEIRARYVKALKNATKGRWDPRLNTNVLPATYSDKVSYLDRLMDFIPLTSQQDSYPEMKRVGIFALNNYDVITQVLTKESQKLQKILSIYDRNKENIPHSDDIKQMIVSWMRDNSSSMAVIQDLKQRYE